MTRPRLAVFGDIVLDLVVFRRESAARDSDARARIVPAPGGSAANFAVWAARAGADVAFFGQAGDDFIGRRLKAELAAEGVAVNPPEGNLRLDPGAPTGIVIVEIEAAGVAAGVEQARTMTTDRGANLTVKLDLIDPAALARREWLHLTGYSFFEPGPRAAALAALETCRRLGLPWSVDPSSYRLLGEYGAGRFLAEVAGAAVLFPNREEAAELTGLGDPEEAAVVLARAFPVVALKLGGEGCLVAAGGRVRHVPPARRSAAAADPTGAGDAFAAGFLCRYLGYRRGAEPGRPERFGRTVAANEAAAPARAFAAARAGAALAAVAVSVVGGRGR